MLEQVEVRAVEKGNIGQQVSVMFHSYVLQKMVKNRTGENTLTIRQQVSVMFRPMSYYESAFCAGLM